jgi:hypothetical protein
MCVLHPERQSVALMAIAFMMRQAEVWVGWMEKEFMTPLVAAWAEWMAKTYTMHPVEEWAEPTGSDTMMLQAEPSVALKVSEGASAFCIFISSSIDDYPIAC